MLTMLPSGDDTLSMAAEFPNLTPEELFDLWTVPEQLQRWWPPVAEVELREGGSYKLSWPAMDWILRGQITRFEPGRVLGFSWSWDHEPDAPMTQVAIVIDAADGRGSRLTLTHAPYPASTEGQEMRQGHLDGWMHFLSSLQQLP